jgi:phage-related protein
LWTAPSGRAGGRLPAIYPIGYSADMDEKPLIWLHGEIKTPPFTGEGRREAGVLLGMIQAGISIGMPRSRPMPSIGAGCHELRVRDAGHHWRIIYRVDPAAVLILAVFPKGTQKTPKAIIDECKGRMARYDEAMKAAKKKGRPR